MVISRIPPRKGPNSPAARRTIASISELMRLLSTGLMGTVRVKRWKVYPDQTGQGYISYRSRTIFGFDAQMGDVFSVIKEEGSEIVARFYDSEQAVGQLKTVVLSRKKKDETGQIRWVPLHQPEVKFSNQELIKLLSAGLGGMVCIKWWKVLPQRTGPGYITFASKSIYGFDAEKGDVFSVIKEEGSEIVARFYKSQVNAERDVGLLKTVVLSRKKKDGTGQSRWSPLRQPQVIPSNQEFTRLLSTGLGGAVCAKWWKVYPDQTGQGCVTYSSKKILGFDAEKGDVFSVIEEKGSEIVARFYESEQAVDLLMTVVLSRKKKGKARQRRWVPLHQPEVISSRSDFQKQNIEIARIKSFLVEELDEGAALETAPRKPLKDGRIRLGIDGKHIYIPGFKAQAETMLWGKIVVEGETKRLYFWPNPERRGVPLNPEGRVLAQRTNGEWEIVWSASSAGWKTKQTALRENFLYAMVNGQTFQENWKVYEARDGEHTFQLEVPAGGLFEYIISETRKHGKSLNISSFWLNPQVSNPELTSLLLNGLGGAVCVKWWKIHPKNTGQGCVTYGFRTIFGFDAKMGDVFSVLNEEGNEEGSEIVARFYKSPENAERGVGLLKTVLLSRKKNGETQWSPLDQPEVLFSRRKQQKQRVATARIKSFLLEELEEGAVIEIAPRKVLKSGQLRFKIDGRFICIPGFQAQAETALWGKIVVEGETKRVYFWENPERSGAPLNPEGRVLAQKTNGKWEIVWSAASDNWRSQKQSAELYGNFLYATVTGKPPSYEYWRVYKILDGGRVRRTAKKTVRGNIFQLEVPGGRPCNYVLSETMEYGKILKICSFWMTPEDRKKGSSPFDSRAIMFRPAGNSWVPFWRRLSDTRAFKKILKQGLVPADHLESVLTKISGKHPEILSVIDALFI